MTEQLKHALILVEQLPAEQQDALAALMQQAVAREREQQQMHAAAVALLDDYTLDEELTNFTALDYEDFYGEG